MSPDALASLAFVLAATVLAFTTSVAVGLAIGRLGLDVAADDGTVHPIAPRAVPDGEAGMLAES